MDEHNPANIGVNLYKNHKGSLQQNGSNTSSTHTNTNQHNTVPFFSMNMNNNKPNIISNSPLPHGIEQRNHSLEQSINKKVILPNTPNNIWHESILAFQNKAQQGLLSCYTI